MGRLTLPARRAAMLAMIVTVIISAAAATTTCQRVANQIGRPATVGDSGHALIYVHYRRIRTHSLDKATRRYLLVTCDAYQTSAHGVCDFPTSAPMQTCRCVLTGYECCTPYLCAPEALETMF